MLLKRKPEEKKDALISSLDPRLWPMSQLPVPEKHFGFGKCLCISGSKDWDRKMSGFSFLPRQTH